MTETMSSMNQPGGIENQLESAEAVANEPQKSLLDMPVEVSNIFFVLFAYETITKLTLAELRQAC